VQTNKYLTRFYLYNIIRRVIIYTVQELNSHGLSTLPVTLRVPRDPLARREMVQVREDVHDWMMESALVVETMRQPNLYHLRLCQKLCCPYSIVKRDMLLQHSGLFFFLEVFFDH
jgi:hypothetical protein